MSYETNPIVCQQNMLLYFDEGVNKASIPYHTKKVSLVTPESKFVCNAEGILTSREQGRKLGLDISRVSTYYYSNIIGHQRNALLPDEENNKFLKPYIYTAYKNNLEITQCYKYLFNNPLNLNTTTSSSNFL